MKPKQFIQEVLIDEMKDIVARHAYIAFVPISAGIEFLGKCTLTTCDHWDLTPKEQKQYKAFEKGVELMKKVDKRYGNIDLKNELRNGLTHTLLPKSKIALSEVRNGSIHFGKENQKTVLVIEILYRDFVRACQIILNRKFNESDKMNKEFLYVGVPK